MKRRRRLFTPRPLLWMQADAYGGKAIPPCSVVKLTAAWGINQNRIFRIGYYGRRDGRDCVWLVNEAGEYEGSTDQKSIRKDFQVLIESSETDVYGDEREILRAITNEELLAASKGLQTG
jgi:hypothetical protein